MFSTELTLRLREKCPAFGRRVGGTASFDKATENGADYEMPHCFVVPAMEEADDAKGNAIAQRVKLTFVTVVVVDNSTAKDDGRGYSGGKAVERVKRELRNALLGWEPLCWAKDVPKVKPGYEDLLPNSRADTVRYRGGSMVKMTDGRLWWQYEWSISLYEGRDEIEALDRHVADLRLEDGVGQVVPPDTPNGTTAQIVGVYGDNGRVPSTEYVFDPNAGTITRRGTNLDADASLQIVWEVAEPRYWEMVKTIYMGYYPELLAKAGGNPSDITPDMYTAVDDLPIDDTVPGRTFAPRNRDLPDREFHHGSDNTGTDE